MVATSEPLSRCAGRIGISACWMKPATGSVVVMVTTDGPEVVALTPCQDDPIGPSYFASWTTPMV